MSISQSTKQKVRRRAAYACEYCGVAERDAGGELTVDHFRPQSKNGDNELGNLVYCCVRCNLYKGNFWLEPQVAPQLWNPRVEPFENHFWRAENGRLLPLTETGELSLRVLKLNRPQLVAYRQQQFLQVEESRMFEETEISVEILIRVNREQREIIKAQKTLLEEQQRLLNILLRSD